MDEVHSLQTSKLTLKATVQDASVLYPKCNPELHIERVLAKLGMGGQLQSIPSLLETAPTAKQNYLRT